MTQRRVYLDGNATAPLRDVARQALLAAYTTCGNASSVHQHGQAARHQVETARKTLALALSARPKEVYFTSGGTEANNTVLQTFKAAEADIFTSTIEHASVLNAAPHATRVGVTPLGTLDLSALDKALHARDTSKPALVSVMLANNETGVLQPMQEIVALAHSHGALVHTDAVQAFGKVAIDFGGLDLDYMTVSSHKIGGGFGVGALIKKESTPLTPLLYGGGHEGGLRSGTVNAPGVAGFAAVAAAPLDWTPIATLRDQMEAAITAGGGHIWGREAPRLPNTSSVRMPGVAQQKQVLAFDLAGFAVSAGSACASGKISPSHVLQAMGIAEDEARETIRISLTPETTLDEIKKFIQEWLSMKTREGQPHDQ